MDTTINNIKIRRINGYLDLDYYFNTMLGRAYFDDEDLYNHGLIDVIADGISYKFWITNSKTGEHIALFKVTRPGSYEDYAELIAEEIAHILNMETAYYDLAMFNGQNGVVSYNFIRDYNSYESGDDIIFEFYHNRLENDEELSHLYDIDYNSDTVFVAASKLNNLEAIWSMLEYKYQHHPHKKAIVFNIVSGLVNKMIFDILTINIDDHSNNWGIYNNNIAPQFDNARILNLHKQTLGIKESLEENSLLLTVDNSSYSNPLELLEHFLKISSSEYYGMIQEKINTLRDNLDKIPISVEAKIQTKMVQSLTYYFLDTMKCHLDKIDEFMSNATKIKKMI